MTDSHLDGQTDRQTDKLSKEEGLLLIKLERFSCQAYMCHNERKSCHDIIEVGTSGPACIKL